MGNAVSFQAAVRLAPDVLRQELQGESVLLNLNSGCYFGLDQVGSRICTALIDAASIEEAVQVLAGEYDVEEPKLREDVQQLISKMSEYGLLELHATS